MRPTILVRPAFAIVALGLAAAHGARAADVTPSAAHIGVVGYATIQAAVDAAVRGDTIHVDEGVWNESVAVTFDSPADLLTIDATGAIVDGGASPAIAVNGPGVFHLVNATFRSDATAVTASGSDAGELSFSVDGSTITAGAGALRIDRAAVSVDVLNVFTVQGDAIVLRDCPIAYVTGFVGGAGGSGLVAENVRALGLDSLHVDNCGGDGIRFRGDQVAMRFCDVRETGRTGIDLRFADLCEAEHNSVTGATYRGISLAWRAGATVIVGDNVVPGGVTGIAARGGDGTIRDNRVSGAVRDGIVWRGNLTRRRVEGRPVGLVANKIVGSGRSAIRIEGSGHRVLNNEITRGDSGGVAISGGGTIAAIRANTVDGRPLAASAFPPRD